MERTYDLNELALMTGLSTRTLRNYLNQGLLNGEKENGKWRFTAKDLDRFFSEPFVKEGLRIKRSSAVFDFLAESGKNGSRSCVILDFPASRTAGNSVSAFFCGQMEHVTDVNFNFWWDKGACRVILTGKAESVKALMKAYDESGFSG